MAKSNLILNKEWGSIFESLPDDQAGKLIKAAYSCHNGEEYEIDDPVLAAVFAMISSVIAENNSKYEKKCEQNARNRAAREEERLSTTVNDREEPTTADNDRGVNKIKGKEIKENIKEKSKPKEKAPSARFVKPTVHDIRAYCLERQNSVDPQTFYDFYESKGWMVGKSPMKDWKATVRTWESRRKEEARAPAKRNQFNDNFDARKYDFDDLETQLLRAQGR